MSLKGINDFFNNLITIELKDGHKFVGLLSRVDYKSHSIQLEDVQDLGNENDKTSIPYDKKIPNKIFEKQSIQEILFKEKHFSEPKKYVQKDFWDPISDEPEKKKNYQEKRLHYNNNNRTQNNTSYNQNRNNNYYKDYKKEQPNKTGYRNSNKPTYQEKKQENDDEYR